MASRKMNQKQEIIVIQATALHFVKSKTHQSVSDSVRISRKLFREAPFLHKFHLLNSVYKRRNFSAVTYEDCY